MSSLGLEQKNGGSNAGWARYPARIAQHYNDDDGICLEQLAAAARRLALLLAPFFLSDCGRRSKTSLVIDQREQRLHFLGLRSRRQVRKNWR